MLLRALPHDSALQVETHGEAALWTLTNYQLADIVDTTALTQWAVVAANSKRAPRVPSRYPRPSRRREPSLDETPQMSTSDEVRAFFGPSSITYVGAD